MTYFSKDFDVPRVVFSSHFFQVLCEFTKQIFYSFSRLKMTAVCLWK